MLNFAKTNLLWTPCDAATPAGAFYDVGAPDGIIMGTDPGVRLIRDWSGNGKHLLQATASGQGTIAFSGPGGGLSIMYNNAAARHAYSGSMGASIDHTMVVSYNLVDTTPANAYYSLVSGLDGAVYTILGVYPTGTKLSIICGGAGHDSNLDVLTGVHAYSAVCDGATNTAWLYVDTTKASGTVVCTALAFATELRTGDGSILYSPDGALIKLAYWNSKISDVDLALAQAWAVRDDGW